jgi:circadian clock protein KaiC
MGTVERTKARRVLIDSLADLRVSAGDEIRFHEFIYSIVQRFSRQGVSVLMTSEVPRLFGTDRLSDSAISPLADNVVILGYQQERNTISRTIAVIKTRASRHDPAVRKFVIGSQGIVLDEPVLPVGDSRQADEGLASVPSPQEA